jgi:hypothetical protein
MTSTASSSISSLTSASGQRPAVMCSFKFSPLPTPRKKRPGIMLADVAAACATIAGWVRTVGQVTPVPSRRVLVARAIPPMTDHTNGLWPWVSVQGWRSLGRCSSLDREYPISMEVSDPLSR